MMLLELSVIIAVIFLLPVLFIWVIRKVEDAQ